MAILEPNGQEIDPATMNTATMHTLPPDAFAGATAADLTAMPADAMEGMTADMMTAMPPMAMGGMDAPMMDDPGAEAQEPDMPPPDDPIVDTSIM